jgi:transposase
MADMTDRAIEWMKYTKSVAPQKPLLLYFAPGAAHAPHHAPNITPVILPPYSPELNPAENVWEYLRKNKLAYRFYETYEDIVQACCDAWNSLMAMPDRIASIAARTWAKVS